MTRLVDRLRDTYANHKKRMPVGVRDLLREAYVRLERTEAIVDAARATVYARTELEEALGNSLEEDE